MTVSEMKRTYREITGKRPKGWRIPAAMFRKLVPEFAEQLNWHNKVNFAFGSEALRKIKPAALGLAEFPRKHPVASM